MPNIGHLSFFKIFHSKHFCHIFSNAMLFCEKNKVKGRVEIEVGKVVLKI